MAKKIVIKRSRQKHFTKDFGGGSISHRVILPSDNPRVKVTKFNPKKGFCPGQNVVHQTDEVVYVLEGKIQILSVDDTAILTAGGTYYTPAGVPTTMVAIEDSRLLCVFFPGENGELPNDD